MKLFRKLIEILFKSAIGLAAIYFTNLILSNYNMSVGMNLYNALIIGVLGISGYFLLYVLVLVDLLLF